MKYLNSKQIFKEHMQHRQMITKQMFLQGEYNNDKEFVVLEFISASATAIGSNGSGFGNKEYATNISDIIMNNMSENNKIRSIQIIDIQRCEINNKFSRNLNGELYIYF